MSSLVTLKVPKSHAQWLQAFLVHLHDQAANEQPPISPLDVAEELFAVLCEDVASRAGDQLAGATLDDSDDDDTHFTDADSTGDMAEKRPCMAPITAKETTFQSDL